MGITEIDDDILDRLENDMKKYGLSNYSDAILYHLKREEILEKAFYLIFEILKKTEKKLVK